MEGQRKLWKEQMDCRNLFSGIKRTFGEYVYSGRLKNMIQEMMLKASLYNKMITLGKTDSKIDFNNHATKHCNFKITFKIEFTKDFQ